MSPLPAPKLNQQYEIGKPVFSAIEKSGLQEFFKEHLMRNDIVGRRNHLTHDTARNRPSAPLY